MCISHSSTITHCIIPVSWMRAEPVWAYRHLWLAAQQLILISLPTIVKMKEKETHELMLLWLSVLKGLCSSLLPSANDRTMVRCAVLRAPLEQLRLILGFLRRDIPIQQTTKNCPFQYRPHIPMEKLVQTFPGGDAAIAVDCFGAVWMQSACTSCGAGWAG